MDFFFFSFIYQIFQQNQNFGTEGDPTENISHFVLRNCSLRFFQNRKLDRMIKQTLINYNPFRIFNENNQDITDKANVSFILFLHLIFSPLKLTVITMVYITQFTFLYFCHIHIGNIESWAFIWTNVIRLNVKFFHFFFQSTFQKSMLIHMLLIHSL